MSPQTNLKASTHLSGCGDVTRALMREKMGHLLVQVGPSAKGASVSALRDMVDPTATGQYALRTAE